MTFTTIGLGDRVVQNPNDDQQMFGAVFSAIFGLSLLCSYLGQYGQWATAAAATSPVDVSHSMAYGGDGPFVDDDTFPTRRASLQHALEQTPDINVSTSNSKSIEERLAAVFVLGTVDIKERRASLEVPREISVPVATGEYMTVEAGGSAGTGEGTEGTEETSFGFGDGY